MNSMHDEIEQRCDHDGFAEQLWPVVDLTIGRDHDGELLVATHAHTGDFVTGVAWQLAKEQIVDDEEFSSVKLRAIFLHVAELACFINFLHQCVASRCMTL
jgi:hypothetical protein